MTELLTALDTLSFRGGSGPVAIVDIGSNSIRLVVYRGLTRWPVPIFNEKVVCGLGLGLAASGRLNPEGVREALTALARFSHLARAMEVELFDVVATAAVRDALDGAEFVAAVEKTCGIHVTVLPGEQEAHLAAEGVLCGVTDADGAVADLGGGSLELVAVDRGRLSGPVATTQLGVLRLGESSDGERTKALAIIEEEFSKVDWFGWGTGRQLYAVGGAWRALARLFVAQTGHPLQVLDNYTLERADALRLLDLVSRQSRKSLEKIPGLSRKRLQHLPMAALLLERVMDKIQPARLVFSVNGMREGRFFGHLPPDIRRQDPLIAASASLAAERARFPEHGEELMRWMEPLGAAEPLCQTRLRHAACLLSDAFWGEHPDYRAEQAFLRVLRVPFLGLDHPARAQLALAVYYRYEGDFTVSQLTMAESLLTQPERNQAMVVGAALRLGHAVSGGVPGLLTRTRLHFDAEALVLEMPADDPVFSADFSERRYDRLAKLLGRQRFEIRRV